MVAVVVWYDFQTERWSEDETRRRLEVEVEECYQLVVVVVVVVVDVVVVDVGDCYDLCHEL